VLPLFLLPVFLLLPPSLNILLISSMTDIVSDYLNGRLVSDYLNLCTVFNCVNPRVYGSPCCSPCRTELDTYNNYYSFKSIHDCIAHFNIGVKYRYDADCASKYVEYLIGQANRCLSDIRHVESKHNEHWRTANARMRSLAQTNVCDLPYGC